MKKKNGLTLISLIITVIVLGMLVTAVVIYQNKSTVKIMNHSTQATNEQKFTILKEKMESKVPGFEEALNHGQTNQTQVAVLKTKVIEAIKNEILIDDALSKVFNANSVEAVTTYRYTIIDKNGQKYTLDLQGLRFFDAENDK